MAALTGSTCRAPRPGAASSHSSRHSDLLGNHLVHRCRARPTRSGSGPRAARVSTSGPQLRLMSKPPGSCARLPRRLRAHSWRRRGRTPSSSCPHGRRQRGADGARTIRRLGVIEIPCPVRRGVVVEDSTAPCADGRTVAPKPYPQVTFHRNASRGCRARARQRRVGVHLARSAPREGHMTRFSPARRLAAAASTLVLGATMLAGLATPGVGPRHGVRPGLPRLRLLAALGQRLPEPGHGHPGPDVLAGLAGRPPRHVELERPVPRGRRRQPRGGHPRRPALQRRATQRPLHAMDVPGAWKASRTRTTSPSSSTTRPATARTTSGCT